MVNNMETGRILMGDIVISMHRAAARGICLMREVFLAVHGALHLWGTIISPRRTTRACRRLHKNFKHFGHFFVIDSLYLSPFMLR